MPFLTLFRALFALVSGAILITGAYLLWSGLSGGEIQYVDGEWRTEREAWRIWIGAGLLVWSALGRFPVLWLSARPDKREPGVAGGKSLIQGGATGSLIHVEEDGAGPTLVACHGWGMDSTIWNELKRATQRELRWVTWDLPGLGRSRLAPGARPALDAYAEDLRGLVLSQGSPVILVGHSIGGMIIQTLARDHPALFDREVAGVVLLNTTYKDPSHTMVLGGLVRALRPLVKAGLKLASWLQPLVWILAWQSYLSGSAHLANRLGFGAHVTRRQLEHVTLLATRNPPGVQAQGIRAMLDWDADGALASVRRPVLVVSGGVDVITKFEAGAHIAGTASAATLVKIPGANHMGLMEQADLYGAQIDAFVDSLSMDGRAAGGPAPLSS